MESYNDGRSGKTGFHPLGRRLCHGGWTQQGSTWILDGWAARTTPCLPHPCCGIELKQILSMAMAKGQCDVQYYQYLALYGLRLPIDIVELAIGWEVGWNRAENTLLPSRFLDRPSISRLDFPCCLACSCKVPNGRNKAPIEPTHVSCKAVSTSSLDWPARNVTRKALLTRIAQNPLHRLRVELARLSFAGSLLPSNFFFEIF